jgi:hypothetical protein
MRVILLLLVLPLPSSSTPIEVFWLNRKYDHRKEDVATEPWPVNHSIFLYLKILPR